MGDNEYVSHGHCKYCVQYHIIWCPKFRFHVLRNDIEMTLKECLYATCREYGYGIKALEVMPDHIHIFLAAGVTDRPCDIVRILKSKTAIRLLDAYPELRQFYKRCGVLWSRGYFLSTIGKISESTVRRYIERQKQADGRTKSRR